MYPYIVSYLRKPLFVGRSLRCPDKTVDMLHPVNVGSLGVKLIETQLSPHVKENQKRAGNANYEACNIDGGIGFVLGQISKGNFEIVIEHIKVA